MLRTFLVTLSFFLFNPFLGADILLDINEAEGLYIQGHYEKSEDKANAILTYPYEVDTSARLRIFILKARLDFVYGRAQFCELWLKRALKLEPNWEPDRYLDAPEFVALWQKTRSQPPEPQKAAATTTSSKTNAVKPQSFDAALKQKSLFWVSLFPGGIGHFHNDKVDDGLWFLSAHALFLFLSSNRVNTDQIIDKRYKSDQALLRSTGIMSIWGFELESLLPNLYAIDPGKAETTEYLLSFFPLGVGQKRNGEISKAYLFAAAQLSGLALFIHAESEDKRDMGKSLLIGSYIYSIWDAWYYHYDNKDFSNPPVAGKNNFSFYPMLSYNKTAEQVLSFEKKPSLSFGLTLENVF